jgi:hypothetical protein
VVPFLTCGGTWRVAFLLRPFWDCWAKGGFTTISPSFFGIIWMAPLLFLISSENQLNKYSKD